MKASLLLAFLFAYASSSAQCPEFYDTFGNPSSYPYWISCTGNDFTLELLSDDAYGPYTINWGDGSSDSGAGYTPGGSNPNHIYSVIVDTLVVTITIPGTGCVVTGVVVMEELVSAAIQIPNGGITKACAPQTMEFLNASTNVSATTMFIWDFGDGSPQETYDVSNWGATVSHTYQKGTVECGTRVTLYAENYCSFGGPSINTYEPILIWDIDDAAIEASATSLCYPDTIVTFNNVTDRNCVAPSEGNFAQRYEKWIFIDYFGPGLDSIVDWRPWPPSQPITIKYPGKGTYEVQLLDSNQCGIDPASITINIVDPPTAAFTISEDTVCTGQEFTLTNFSSGGANEYFWKIEGVTGWVNTNADPFNYSFLTEGKYEFKLVANVAQGTVSCTDTVSHTIIVLPGPESSFTITPEVACDTLITNVVNTTVNGVNWSWDFGNGTNSNLRQPVNPIRYDGKGEYIIGLTVTSANNCNSILYDTVHVYKTPQVNFTALNACEGTPINFIDNTIIDANDPIVSWAWNFGDGSSSADQNPIHQYASDASYSVRLAVATANCTSDTTKPITLHPLPSAIMYLPDTSGCNPFVANFQNFSTVSNKYEWDFGDGSPVDTTTAPSHTFANNSASNIVYAIRLVAITNKGCSDTTYQEVLVYPAATGSFTHNGTPDCGPMLVQFVNTSAGGTNYQWDFGDGSPLSSAPNPAHLYRNQTSFIEIYNASLIVTSANGCTDATTQSITVYPEPNFDFSISPSEGCTPLTVDFSVNTNGNYAWDFGDGNTSNQQSPTNTYVHNNLFATTYNVRLIGTSSFGCSDTVIKTVTVKPNPVASFTIDTKSGCSPLEIELTNNSAMAISYQWQYGEGSVSTETNFKHRHTYFNNTSADMTRVIKLTAIASNGCTAEVTDTLVVFGNPVAKFDQPAPACTPASVSFINRSENADSYRWNFDDGSPFENTVAPTHTFNNSSTSSAYFDVDLVAYSINGCPDTTTEVVMVYPLPSSDFVATPTTGCHPLSVELENTTTGGSGYEWFYGDGTNSTNANPFHDIILKNTSSSPVTYEVQLVATSSFGCSKKKTTAIQVYPQVIAEVASVAAQCTPMNVLFNNESVNASSYVWDFDDGNFNYTDKHASHRFSNTENIDKTFDVSLIAKSIYGCSDTTIVPVTAFFRPNAGFDLSDDQGCHVFELDITNTTTGGVGFQWDFGDGKTSTSSSSTLSNEYENNSDSPVNRSIRLVSTSSNGCSDTLIKTITVFPKVIADFEIPPPNCTPYEVKMFNRSLGATEYEWTFPTETSSAPNPTTTFINVTNTNQYLPITLLARSAYNCTHEVTKNVLVHPRPVAIFTADPVTQEYPSATVSVDNQTPDGSWSYKWDFGDEILSFSKDPDSIRYATWGTYVIQLAVSGEFCSDSTTQTIVIDPTKPKPAFTQTEEEGCVPLTVYFTNESKYANNYRWTFGDGNSSQRENPKHTYTDPGVYTVSLVASGPGGSDVVTKNQLIKVRENAVAFFTLNPQYPEEVYKDREPVDFYNFSENDSIWLWDFGDGQGSKKEDPSHSYIDIGTFDVQLIANNYYNCPDTFKITTAVNVVAGGRLQMPNAFTPNPNGSNGGVTSDMMLSNDVFFPFFDKVEKFHMQIFNRWGEFIFESFDIDLGWDGYFNGVICPQDVYVYKVEVVYPGGETDVLVGDVTLLK